MSEITSFASNFFHVWNLGRLGYWRNLALVLTCRASCSPTRGSSVSAGKRDDGKGALSSILVSNPPVETSTGCFVLFGAFLWRYWPLLLRTLCARQASWVSVGRRRHSSWDRSLSKIRARSTASHRSKEGCSWQGGQCVQKSPSAVSRCRRNHIDA